MLHKIQTTIEGQKFALLEVVSEAFKWGYGTSAVRGSMSAHALVEAPFWRVIIPYQMGSLLNTVQAMLMAWARTLYRFVRLIGPSVLTVLLVLTCPVTMPLIAYHAKRRALKECDNLPTGQANDVAEIQAMVQQYKFDTDLT